MQRHGFSIQTSGVLSDLQEGNSIIDDLGPCHMRQLLLKATWRQPTTRHDTRSFLLHSFFKQQAKRAKIEL